MGYKEIMKDNEFTGRWRFDYTYEGIRYRKMKKVPKSAVKVVYDRWLKSVIDSNGERNKIHMLYEKFMQFMIYCKEDKNRIRYQRYCFAISLFKDFFKNMNLNDFKSYHVDEYKLWRRNNTFTNQSKALSNSALNHDIKMLSHFFNYCIDRNYYYGKNPCKGKKEKEGKRKIRLTPNQIKEILELSDGNVQTAIYLAIFAGLRRGEICLLKWDNILFNESRIDLPGSITKDKEDREVFIPQTLSHFLLNLKKTSNTEYVLSYRNCAIKDFRTSWECLRDKLSFKKLPDGKIIHFHDLRHVYSQILKDLGVPIVDIQSQLGHYSSQLTEKFYANYASSDIRNNINKMDSYFENNITIN